MTEAIILFQIRTSAIFYGVLHSHHSVLKDIKLFGSDSQALPCGDQSTSMLLVEDSSYFKVCCYGWYVIIQVGGVGVCGCGVSSIY